MSDTVYEITENSLNDKQLSPALQGHNSAEAKENPVQYSSCLGDFQRVQQKKQSASVLTYNKKLLKLAIYSKCQVKV